MAATPHGSADEKLRCSVRPSAPAGVPQRWQNFAPEVRGASHAEHVAPVKGEPQFEQNFPAATVPQVGHRVVAVDAAVGEAIPKITRLHRRVPTAGATIARAVHLVARFLPVFG